MPGFSIDPGSDECDEVEQELRLVSLALDAAGDSIIIHRVDGVVVRFNKAAAEQQGMTVAEFEALPPWGFAGRVSEEVREARLESLKTQGELRFTSRRDMPDGSHLIQEIHNRWVDAPGGPYIVAVSRDVTEQIRTREVLEDLAFHDPLTGLANRALFDDRLDLAISSARRHDDLLGLAYMDLDDFKDINDDYGHDVGDHVLIALGKRLESSVRQEDTVARLGGDEFAIIFPRIASVGDLKHMTRKLIDKVREPISVGPRLLTVTASAGVAVLRGDDDARSLLMRADIEMYDAKRTSTTSRRAVLRRGPRSGM